MPRAYVIDLGIVSYTPAIKLQEYIFHARLEGRLPPVVILQECLPVFTVGQSGKRSNILATQTELDLLGIQVLEVSRGGDVTYHGPGQLICSPIIYLGDLGLNANQYLHRLEDLILVLLKPYSILAEKDPDHPGAWVKHKKIGSVGLAVKSGYTMHGFSLNINLDLHPFTLINPCGVPQMPVTGISQELNLVVQTQDVKGRLAEAFHEVLDLDLEPAGEDLLHIPELQSHLLETMEKTE
jgi:lipoyl(octanoyl) transferase